MKKAELVFIPFPILSHLVSTVKTAKLLLHRDDRLSITLLIIKFPKDTSLDSYIDRESDSSDPNISRLHFINLPSQDEVPVFSHDYVNNQITHVRDIISNLIKQPSELAGLVLDVLCTKFVEVANEFSIPAYVFFTSGACSLGAFLLLVSLKFEQNQDLTQYDNSDVELSIPCFSIPVPAKVLPESRSLEISVDFFKRVSETKGIMVNTFYELEPFAIEALLSDHMTPKIYPVGPILNSINGDQRDDDDDDADDVKKWLDDQPEKSVVFLCFGTMGSFNNLQVKEIAMALEGSGSRFLWSLRKPERNATVRFATEYENFEEVLPEGFLERTKGIGKVIGWAAQVVVLSHPAVGGFVSHCGWNSILESVWFGVPIATFPLYAEQQLNAFQLVKEQGMAEMIRLDYKIDLGGDSKPEIVGSEEIEAAIRRLMVEEKGRGVREKVKEMQEKARLALEEGGSSCNAQCLFIEDVLTNFG